MLFHLKGNRGTVPNKKPETFCTGISLHYGGIYYSISVVEAPSMKESIPRWQIAGFLFTSVLGTFLHFLFDLTGGSTVAALFSAVNESIWEHIKLIYYPMLIFSLIVWQFWGKQTETF